MDEKTQSEIFEEQLNSLHKPIKQEKNTPSAPESENKNNQALVNKEALANQNLANQNLEANQSLEADEPSYISTGIAYLDDKIKNRSIIKLSI